MELENMIDTYWVCSKISTKTERRISEIIKFNNKSPKYRTVCTPKEFFEVEKVNRRLARKWKLTAIMYEHDIPIK
jgi:hypothetical protein